MEFTYTRRFLTFFLAIHINEWKFLIIRSDFQTLVDVDIPQTPQMTQKWVLERNNEKRRKLGHAP
jgi:hypothetical protein